MKETKVILLLALILILCACGKKESSLSVFPEYRGNPAEQEYIEYTFDSEMYEEYTISLEGERVVREGEKVFANLDIVVYSEGTEVSRDAVYLSCETQLGTVLCEDLFKDYMSVYPISQNNRKYPFIVFKYPVKSCADGAGIEYAAMGGEDQYEVTCYTIIDDQIKAFHESIINGEGSALAHDYAKDMEIDAENCSIVDESGIYLFDFERLGVEKK